MRKTKRFTAILLATVLIGGCGNSSVSQEEYDRVVSERDEYKEKYESLLGQKNPEEEKNVAGQEKGIKQQVKDEDIKAEVVEEEKTSTEE